MADEWKKNKNYDLKSKDEPTACTHSAPHSAVQNKFYSGYLLKCKTLIILALNYTRLQK